ncbi:recombinase family protein [Scatolibacter rhodanostii]|uniref:recombinase family protein n=1 Tax=Scatolibacter rhodanostii TaxID=2014781 RepID=UPI000C06B391|nr:recombinase family protein [Scatolibacter rhodanostii]
MARIRKSQTDEKSTVKKIVWYIALYIRLSKDDGNDESLSVTNQKKILAEYVEKFFQGEYVIIDYYVDDGRTGTDYDRPDFQRLIQDVESGKVNCVICKNLARAFRNYSDQGYFIESFFPLHGTRFITLGDPKVDTYLNPEAVSGMEVPINGLMNDRFAAQTSNSVRRTFDNKRRNGEFIGAFAPYGYEKHPTDKNALVIDEEAAQVVRDIFQWFVYGDGSTETLVDENDGLWMGTSVSRLLKNKVYMGTMVQGKQRVISYKVHDMVNVPEEDWFQVNNTHEAIISLELFEKAQELHAKDTRTAPGKTETYLFSGFLKCADCGKSMTRRASNGFVYYNCSTYKRKSKDKCTKHTMRLDVLEKTVLLVIQKQIELVESLEEVLNNINQAPVVQTKSTRLEHLLKLREQELEKIEDLISGLYMDWKNGDITREQYRKMKEKFEQQEEQLKEVIEHIRGEIGTMEQGITSDDPYLQAFLKHKNIQELSQGLLVELVKTILIHENGEITVQFKLENQYKRMIDFIENNKYSLTVVENKVG